MTQSTFGPTEASITEVMSKGYDAWLQGQFSAQTLVSYKAYWKSRDAAIKAVKPTSGAHLNEINHAFWANAINGQDQLRQRVALALSEIFVVSIQDACAENNLRGTTSYFDMLGQKALGNYRDLLEAVALHPVMGCYLSHLRNQKEDIVTGRVPDENFAREIMQLFSIGLVQLNTNGTPKLNSAGQPIESYTSADVSGLAKVFTGWSWECPKWPSDLCFKFGLDQGQISDVRWEVPMRPYAKFHSTSEKRFLGKVIPAQATADPAASLKVALDTLASHPNVGPFIGKQLIQRLVTSNPSPAYVQRVATAFNSSGGSMQALVKAVLLDSEARNFQATNDPSFGKAREPLLKLSALFRAYGAKSATGSFLMWSSNEPTALAQAPLQAPSVFNYFRPGFTPPNSSASRAGLVEPEMQIFSETSYAGYVNYIKNGLWSGWGACGYLNTNCQSSANPRGTPLDIQLDFKVNANNPILALSKTPASLVEDVNQRLMYGTMPADLKKDIADAVQTVYVGSLTKQSAADALETSKLRVMTALLLTMASAEFQVQK